MCLSVLICLSVCYCLLSGVVDSLVCLRQRQCVVLFISVAAGMVIGLVVVVMAVAKQ